MNAASNKLSLLNMRALLKHLKGGVRGLTQMGTISMSVRNALQTHKIPVGTRIIIGPLDVSKELEGEKGVVREHLTHLYDMGALYSVRLDNEKQIQASKPERMPWSYAHVFSEKELIVDPNQEPPIVQEKKPWWKIF